MTIDDKRVEIATYCRNHACDECPLARYDNPCYETASDEIIHKNYELIFSNKDLYKTNCNIPISEDNVNRPAHYTDGKTEVIEYIEDKKLGFCLGNAIKYISRAGKKDPSKEVEDLNKAIWYINRRIMEIQEARE